MSTTAPRLSNSPAKPASPGLSERLCQSGAPLWKRQLAHPFVAALGNEWLATTPLIGIRGDCSLLGIGIAVITAMVSAEDIATATRELATALFEPRGHE